MYVIIIHGFQNVNLNIIRPKRLSKDKKNYGTLSLQRFIRNKGIMKKIV